MCIMKTMYIAYGELVWALCHNKECVNEFFVSKYLDKSLAHRVALGPHSMKNIIQGFFQKLLLIHDFHDNCPSKVYYLKKWLNSETTLSVMVLKYL